MHLFTGGESQDGTRTVSIVRTSACSRLSMDPSAKTNVHCTPGGSRCQQHERAHQKLLVRLLSIKQAHGTCCELHSSFEDDGVTIAQFMHALSN